MEDVIAVIVTYNRLSLLQKAIASVKDQLYAPATILVINNGSTDGTKSWLLSQPDIVVVNKEVNEGASGGFYHAILSALNYHTKWLWIMDDDTLCEPSTLGNLVNRSVGIEEKIGFIGSRCNWADGEPHLMNVPDIKPIFNRKIPFNKYDEHHLFLIPSNSWVSILLSTAAIKEVGLPYKEFFFWSDDLEYTQRITKAGYLGFYCTDSIVLHDTFKNYCPDFYRETVNNIWKYKYGFRNEFFLVKKNKGYLYFLFWLFIKISYTSLKVFKIRKDNYLKFIGVLFSAAWQSLFFNPSIDKVSTAEDLTITNSYV